MQKISITLRTESESDRVCEALTGEGVARNKGLWYVQRRQPPQRAHLILQNPHTTLASYHSSHAALRGTNSRTSATQKKTLLKASVLLMGMLKTIRPGRTHG